MNRQLIPKLMISLILISTIASGLSIQLTGAPTRTLEASSAVVRDYWPTTSWRYSTAEGQGMNSTKLKEMMEHIQDEGFRLDSVVVIRNGYVVLEEYPRPDLYSQNTMHLLYSATKSITSMLIGIALGEGYIDNIQHKLVDFFPNRSIANMDSRKQAITLEHVLTMTSGLQWDEQTYGYDDPRNSIAQMRGSPDWVQFVLDRPMANEPGTTWTYNGGGSHLLSAIINKATGTNPWTYARERLLNPLGISAFWMTDPQGLPLGYTHLYLRPLDMAKLGFLYLNKGVWDGDQIVPPEWVNASAETHFSTGPDVGYGYQWWIHPSAGLYAAWGMAGQRIAVVPDYDMVVVFTGSVTSYDPGYDLIHDYILPAAKALPIVVPADYPSIQEAINNAAEGDTIFVRAGTYYEHVTVNKTVTLVGEEASTTIVDGNGTGHVINVASNNVTVTGFTVRRSGDTQWPALEAGICINHSSGCVISGNRLFDNGFCGISLLYSQRNTINDNIVARSSWSGIHLLTSSHNVISNNTVDSTYGGINGHASSHYNNFTNNVITNSTHGMFYHDANYNNISRNSISDVEVEGIWLQDQVSYNTVYENYLTNCSVGIKLLGPNYHNVISGNLIANCQSGIRIQSAGFTEIYRNTIVHNYGGEWDAGIRLDYAGNTRIHSNVIRDNWRGILLYTSSSNVSIYGNNMTYNDYAIRVASGGSSYLNVSGNIVMHNRGYGIGLTGFGGTSSYAIISRNILANNSDGIALGQYSSRNTIRWNNISLNSCGLYIDYSTQNTITQNNIIDNERQVYISTGSVNIWDYGYPAGGNYWSNYANGDIYRGKDQEFPGGDGIGDSPHILDANNRDNYPLVNPYSGAPNDVAVEAVTAPKYAIGQGSSLPANVTVTNQGVYTETFNVTLFANTTLIGTREVVLPAGTSTALTFVWNTSGFARGSYILWVCAGPVSGETDTVDNTYAIGPFTITFLGDMDGDRDVDIFDMVSMVALCGIKYPDPRYNQLGDLDLDGDVDIFDIVVATGNYGERW